MHKRMVLVAARLVLGIATLSALLVQAIKVNQVGLFNPLNFFGYFTNLSNIFAATVFIISALYLLMHRKPCAIDDVVRGAAVLYMTVTGVIYTALLAGQDLGLLLPWVNILLHYIMPIAVLADWLFWPPRTKLRTKQVLGWLILPVIYLAYSLIRGAVVHWYPYPFFNPDKVNGYAGVAMYCLGIFVAFLLISWALKTLGNKLKRNIA